MRVLPALAMVSVFCVLTSAVQADEFGPRFWGQAPAGLGDYTAPDVSPAVMVMDDQTMESLQEIAPAAGDVEKEQANEADQSVLTEQQ